MPPARSTPPTATDPDAGTTLTYSLSGADAALFNIDATTGAWPSWPRPTTRRQPMPAATTSTTSGRRLRRHQQATKDVAITVTNVNDGPVITSSNAASFAENTAGTVYTATATDRTPERR